MMGFVERTDGSYLVASPGQTHGHLGHEPFLMARAGTRVAAALGLTPARGVVPGAFDATLDAEGASGFVYRCLRHTSIDIVSETGPAVRSDSRHMAQMRRIVPGARVRGDIEAWSASRLSLRGGHLADSAAHPDAGRVWSFGSYRQALTDAVEYTGGLAEVRLTSGAEARGLEIRAGDAEELWVVSASTAASTSQPTRLEHSAVAFEFLSGAEPVVAECREARGRHVPQTELPCSHPSSASRAGMAGGTRFPPFTEFCYLIEILTR